MQLADAYKSVIEALTHGGFHHGADVEVELVDSEDFDPERLADADGILIPGGFGERGIEGKIAAARIARERGIPYLGICLGMQIAVVEFARHVAGMERRQLDRVRPRDAVPRRRPAAGAEGGLRHGRHDAARRRPGEAPRRHPGARDLRRGGDLQAPPPPLRGQQPAPGRLEDEGLVCGGTSPDERLVEIIELPDHPFFVASQFHPEFNSRPNRPEPLFREFVGAAARHAGERPADGEALEAVEPERAESRQS